MTRLTCADLFCGAGGFSEGFRQAGFHVTKALDIWAPAVATHEHNHPDTEAIRGDILAYEPERLGSIDVLIGSPPCTEFSFANRGGGGDIEQGMRLVYRFLRFVYELQPRWWVMENVPRVLEFLPPEIPLRKLGIDKKGSLEIPVCTVLVSADYGAPQKRARAFSGNFPLPPATHREVGDGTYPWRTLRDVVEGLPDPLRGVVKGGKAPLRDPVYDFDLPIDQLTDHFSSDLLLNDEEVRENQKAKEDHSWYGRMSFPDELDRPARTVMATNLRVSRETTVIDAGHERYRRLSVREASSVQGFPITYQWWGATSSLKYKLVGNAVAPPVAFAIASEILATAALPVPERPYVIERVDDPAPAASETERRRTLPLDRRFREHIPGSKLPGYRVDLDNLGARTREAGPDAISVRGPASPAKLRDRGLRDRAFVEWRAVLYRGGGKALRQRAVGLDEALGLLTLAIADAPSRHRATSFLATLERRFANRVPSATDLQLIRSERKTGPVTPYVLLEEIGETTAKHFSDQPRVVRLDSRRDPDYVPLRIAATLVATAYVAALANDHPERVALRLPRVARATSAAEPAAPELGRR